MSFVFFGLRFLFFLFLLMEGFEEKKGFFGEFFFKDFCAIFKQYEKRVFYILQLFGLFGTFFFFRFLLKQSILEDSLNVIEREQEENIQICIKVIVFFRIVIEEVVLFGVDQLVRGQEFYQKFLESVYVSIRYFSGFELGQFCILVIYFDLYDGEKDNFGIFQIALVYFMFYSKSCVDDKQSGFYGSKELFVSIEEDEEFLLEQI